MNNVAAKIVKTMILAMIIQTCATDSAMFAADDGCSRYPIILAWTR
jgi:hypothetical protein